MLTERLPGECAWWGLGDRKIVGKDAGNVIRSELKINEKQDCSAHWRPGAGNDRGWFARKGSQRESCSRYFQGE